MVLGRRILQPNLQAARRTGDGELRHARLGKSVRGASLRNAEAGDGDHVEIVRAVADGHGLLKRKAALGNQRFQPLALGVLVDNRLLHRTGQLVAVEFEHIGNGLIKADPLGEIVGKECEAA